MYVLIQRGSGGMIATFDGTTKALCTTDKIVGGHKILLGSLGLKNDVMVVDVGFFDSIPDRSDKADDLRIAKTVIDQTVAEVVKHLPASSGPVNNQAIATAVANELAKRLGNG